MSELERMIELRRPAGGALPRPAGANGSLATSEWAEFEASEGLVPGTAFGLDLGLAVVPADAVDDDLYRI